MKKKIQNKLEPYFGKYKWFRKWCGGYWQLWMIDISGISDLWFKITEDEINIFRPGCGRGNPFCEYYPWNWSGQKTEITEKIEKQGTRHKKLKRILKNG